MSENLVVTAASTACGHCDICGCELYLDLAGGNVSVTIDTLAYKAQWCTSCTGKAYALLAGLVKGQVDQHA